MAYIVEESNVKNIVWDDNPDLADTRATISDGEITELIVTNANSFNIVNSLNVDLLTHLRDVITVVLAELEPEVEP